MFTDEQGLSNAEEWEGNGYSKSYAAIKVALMDSWALEKKALSK